MENIDEELAKLGAIIKEIEEMTGWTDETENEECTYYEW